MTTEEVRGRVEAIRAVAYDDEAAHSNEDRLYTDVLRAIGDGADNAAALAKEALTTKAIDFERWCA